MSYTPGTIILHSRRYVDPRRLVQSEIDILDISHALANLCRYGGHAPRFYSVAEHSLEISNWLARAGKPLETQFAGLLHDGAETYVPDISRPLKRDIICAGLRDLEDRIQASIYKKFGVDTSDIVTALEIQDADNDLLASECVSLWGCQPEDWGIKPPKDYVQVAALRPRDARVLFEQRFHELQVALKEGT